MHEVIHVLMGRAIDYAGLFPPAGLAMREAVENYGQYRRGKYAWMLGSIVVPVARLEEFGREFERVCCTREERPWPVTLLGSREPAADLELLERWRPEGVVVEALEVAAGSAEEAEKLLEVYPREVRRFVECTPEAAAEVAPVLAKYDAQAKLRMGGLKETAIPEPRRVAHFLAECAAKGVGMKATAGLHHAVRREARLSYEPDSASAKMHGFLNLLFAGMLAYLGCEREVLTAVLKESVAEAFRITGREFCCHQRGFSVEQIAKARRSQVMSFGSCSFTEPVLELQELGWL